MTTPAQAYQALRDVSAASRGKKMSAATCATLTAIAGAESGWRLNAVGDVGLQTATWGPSYGLWQIRTLKAETGRGTARDINFLKRGLYQQASAAYDVWSKQGLGAWSTYKSGSYRQYTAQARTGASSTPAPTTSAPEVSQDTSGGVSNAAALFPGGALDPLNWPGSIAGGVTSSAASAVWGQVQPFAITALFVLGGLALVVVGATVTTQPARQRLENRAGDVAGTAAKIGVMAA